ncbi:ATP phosphoribosyltransferase regulatory subunit [Bacillaceae bacterium SIJ1]|nr:ATP phosphoribosyltransferase regulatory subunit [Litoribacterium kuwaitense]
MFEKPLGMRDTLPALVEKKQGIRQTVSQSIRSWGYRKVQTPTLEYYETVGAESAISDQQLFKLLDQQGHTLVLRPDMTVPIARIAASRFKQTDYPLRLSYDANVFRAQEQEGGKPAEFEQIGVELIGDGSLSADAEVLTLMIHCLKSAGIEEFSVTVGHIGFLKGLFAELLDDDHLAESLMRFLYNKNFVGYTEMIDQLTCSDAAKEKLRNVLTLRANENWFEAASALASNGMTHKALHELNTLFEYVKEAGLESYVKMDVSLVSHMSYYTGILFEGYAQNMGAVLCNGGRYNGLMGKFERDTEATGFGLRLDRLAAIAPGDVKEPKPKTILFDEATRAEAIQRANALRLEGDTVVTQDINGVKDIDTFRENHDIDLDYTTGKGEQG